MSSQGSLFDAPPPPTQKGTVVLDRFKGAMVFAAVGDALGWPTEFMRPHQRRKPPFPLPVQQFQRWHKMVGGRWWGYQDEIRPGEYSDDTQLSLAVARSLSSQGDFEPSRFAYYELPLWLNYERGGGRSVKMAARHLIRRRGDWSGNFYKYAELDYRAAGANGAAMRNLPIALATVHDEEKLVRNSFLNAIITHGHPRAIIGTILIGLAVRYALLEGDGTRAQLIDYLLGGLDRAPEAVADDQQVRRWVNMWDKGQRVGSESFKALWSTTKREADRYLNAALGFINRPALDYYQLVGALESSTRGSGLATVCTAIHLFLRGDEPGEARLYRAVNTIGSDTDTIATFLGAILGARHGLGVVPLHLAEQLQDRDYILKTATRLHAIAEGRPSDYTEGAPLDRQEAFLRILAWEIGLHEMFWNAIDEGGTVVHPTLCKGTITRKREQRIARAGFVTRLINIHFDCGQSCLFHSRVEHEQKVVESLGADVERALGYAGGSSARGSRG